MAERGQRKYTIEKATWRDLLALSALEQACFGPDAWPLIELMGVLTFPGVVRYRALGEGNLVGFVAGDPRTKDNAGWILTLAVDENWRRMGIAQDLMARCEERLHMPRMKLTVRRGNSAAIRLYEKLGYEQVDIWTKYYRNGEDGLVFSKEMAWV